MRPESFWNMGCLALSLASFSSGCAWRSGQAEHYIGPVWFRYVTPPTGKAYVSQVVRYGIATEAGPSSGIALGMSERITVAPISSGGKRSGTDIKAPRWSMPLSIAPAATESSWNLSLLYLRIEDMPAPVFHSRTTYGVEAVVGTEATAFSIGAVTRTLSTPPGNAFSKLHFQTAHPMDARAKVWPDVSELGVSPAELLRETNK